MSFIDPDADGMPGIHFALVDIGLLADLVLVANVDTLGVGVCHVENEAGVAGLTVEELSLICGPASSPKRVRRPI